MIWQKKFAVAGNNERKDTAGYGQIRFTEACNVFRLLKGFTTIWEGFNILELYSVQVFQHFRTLFCTSFNILELYSVQVSTF